MIQGKFNQKYNAVVRHSIFNGLPDEGLSRKPLHTQLKVGIFNHIFLFIQQSLIKERNARQALKNFFCSPLKSNELKATA